MLRLLAATQLDMLGHSLLQLLLSAMLTTPATSGMRPSSSAPLMPAGAMPVSLRMRHIQLEGLL